MFNQPNFDPLEKLEELIVATNNNTQNVNSVLNLINNNNAQVQVLINQVSNLTKIIQQQEMRIAELETRQPTANLLRRLR